MELIDIADAFAQAAPWIDENRSHYQVKQVGGKKKRVFGKYYPGLPPMTEQQVCEAFKEWWDEAATSTNPEGLHFLLEQPYPKLPKSNTCDLVISSSKTRVKDAEWWIEFKRIQFVGNNGKNNDYGAQKLLSPYLKDRSFSHDVSRLAEHGGGRRKAVILFVFDYNQQSCDESKRRFPDLLDPNPEAAGGPKPVHENLRATCSKNQKKNLDLSIADMLPLLNALNNEILGGRLSGHINRTVDGLWRHPCGGRLQIHAWEVSV